jgi:hypothetical protein
MSQAGEHTKSREEAEPTPPWKLNPHVGVDNKRFGVKHNSMDGVPPLTNSRYTHLIITDEKYWPRRFVKRQFTNEDLEKYRRKKIAFVAGAEGGDEDAGRSVFSHGRSGKSSALPLILEEDFVDVIKLEASECQAGAQEGDVCWTPPLNFIIQTDVFSSLATFMEKKYAHVHNYLCAIQQDPAVEKYVMDAYGSVSPLCVVEPRCQTFYPAEEDVIEPGRQDFCATVGATSRGCASQDREQRRGRRPSWGTYLGRHHRAVEKVSDAPTAGGDVKRAASEKDNAPFDGFEDQHAVADENAGEKSNPFSQQSAYIRLPDLGKTPPSKPTSERAVLSSRFVDWRKAQAQQLWRPARTIHKKDSRLRRIDVGTVRHVANPAGKRPEFSKEPSDNGIGQTARAS